MRTTYSAIITLLLLMIASTTHAESIHIYPSEHIRSLIIIGKYGYVDVVIYASKDINTCNKIITISKNNESILSSYNAPSWLHRVIKKILENNLTNSIKLHLNGDIICYAVFEYNMFNHIDRALMTGIINNDSTCLGNTSLLDLIESMPATQLLEKLGTIGIYINYSSNAFKSCISKIAGKIFYLPGNASYLKKIHACYLPSSLGLPRVAIISANDLLGFKTLGENFSLRVLVVNNSVVNGRFGDRLLVLVTIAIKAPYMKPLKALIDPNSRRPKHIELRYVNNTGFVEMVFDKCNCSSYELFLVFQTMRSGNYTVNVTEKFFTPRGVVTIKQYAWFIYPHRCGVIEVEAPPVSRYESSSPLYFLVFALVVLSILAAYIVLYMRR